MSTFTCKLMYLQKKHLPTCHMSLGFSTFSAGVLEAHSEKENKNVSNISKVEWSVTMNSKQGR